MKSSLVQSQLSTKGANKVPIILCFKIKRMISTWRKKAKMSRHRWNILREWVQTQKTYIKDLDIITSRIQKPMVDGEIISEAQDAILFRNVDVIAKLSITMQEVIEKFLKNWRPGTTEIGTMLLQLYPFFKIYIEYCNQYYKGQNILKAVRNLPEMIALQKALPMDIDSYLIKPIQRPPKYMLLLRDYKKHLLEYHPDYKKLCEAMDRYHQVNEINNNAIARESKVSKMMYLEKLYGEVLESNRQYIRQFDCCTYKNNAKVYVLTDLLIVTEIVNYKETLYKAIHLDHTSFIHKPSDGKYFTNIVFVCGKYETIHLMFDSSKARSVELNVLNKLMKDICDTQEKRRSIMLDKKIQHQLIKVPVTLAENKRKQVKFQSFLRVTVDGVEKRPVSAFKSDTYYVIKYQMPWPWKFFKLNYTRYSTIQQIYNYMKKHFPQLVLPDLDPDIFNVGIYDQTKNKSLIMEYRCMAIEDFLNRLLRWEKIMSNPIFILETLKIDNNIWQFAITKHKCQCNMCVQLHSITPTIDYFMTKIQKYEHEKQSMKSTNFCMRNYAVDEFNIVLVSKKHFNTIPRIYAYLNAFEGKTSESRMYYPPKNMEAQLTLAFINLTRDHQVSAGVNSYTTVGQVMRHTGLKIGIKYFGDFGLFIKYNGIPRLLDTDELIFDVVAKLQQEGTTSTKQEGLFSTIKEGFNVFKKWGTELVMGKKSKLIIKKHLFLTPELQSQAYKDDPVRYQLIIEQAFYNIFCETLTLADRQLMLICAIFICLKSTDKLQHMKRGYFPVQTLMQIIPQSKKKILMENTKWRKQLITTIEQYKGYVLSQPPNRQKLYDCVMDIVQQKVCWGAMLFATTNYEPSTLEGKHFNILTGINHKHIFVVPPKGQKLLLQIPLQVLDYKVTPFSIFITLDDCKYRFDGQMLYTLKKMIQKYKLFQQEFSESLHCAKSRLYQSKYFSMKSMRL